MLMTADLRAAEIYLPTTVAALRRLHADFGLIVVVHTRQAFHACAQLHHSCLLDDWKSSSLPHGSHMWRRLELVRDLLANEIGVLTIDADIAYFQDPLPWVAAFGSADIYYQRECSICDLSTGNMPAESLVNIGFWLAKATEGAKSFLQVLLDAYEPAGMSQPRLYSLMSVDTSEAPPLPAACRLGPGDLRDGHNAASCTLVLWCICC